MLKLKKIFFIFILVFLKKNDYFYFNFIKKSVFIKYKGKIIRINIILKVIKKKYFFI